MIKKILTLSLILTLLFPVPNASAFSVYCTNCSEKIIQLLEYVKDIEQLAEAVKQYEEMVTQTFQGIRLIEENVLQYKNMLLNTASLPLRIKNKLMGELKQLAQGIVDIGSIYGDIKAIHDIYQNLFPGYTQLANEITGSVSLPTRLANYHKRYEQWHQQANEAAERAFGLSAQHLQDLVESGEFESQIQELLAEPEGQKEALDAANQLAGMQLDEGRHLRALLATHIQAQQQIQMARQAEMETEEAKKRAFYKVNQEFQPLTDFPAGY